MLILSHVAAEFRRENGTQLFRITREDVNQFLQAPDALRKNPYFNMLVDDGSIQIPETVSARRSLEQDPTASVGADGKSKPEPKPEDTPKSTAGESAASAPGASKSAGRTKKTGEP